MPIRKVFFVLYLHQLTWNEDQKVSVYVFWWVWCVFDIVDITGMIYMSLGMSEVNGSGKPDGRCRVISKTIHRHTLLPPNQTHSNSHTSTQLIYPTIPTPHSIVPSKPSPLLPLYAQSATKTRISPSNAHMSLGRFCCALPTGYKRKTSNIDKRL